MVLTHIRITQNGYSSQHFNQLINNFIANRKEYLSIDYYSNIAIKEIDLEEFIIKRELLSAYLNSPLIKLPGIIVNTIRTNPKIFRKLFKRLVH